MKFEPVQTTTAQRFAAAARVSPFAPTSACCVEATLKIATTEATLNSALTFMRRNRTNTAISVKTTHGAGKEYARGLEGAEAALTAKP